MIRKISSLIFAFSWLDSYAQSSLPSCPNSPVSQWSFCFGTYEYRSGAKYIGEWRAGKRGGWGVMTYANNATFAGTWEEGKPHGTGTISLPDGSYGSASYKNGVLNGRWEIWSESLRKSWVRVFTNGKVDVEAWINESGEVEMFRSHGGDWTSPKLLELETEVRREIREILEGRVSGDSDWDWDEFNDASGELIWRCRGIQTGQLADNSKCTYDTMTDYRWPKK